MTLRHSPAFAYPLQPSWVAYGAWSVLSLLALVLLLLFALYGAGVGTQQWLRVGVMALLCCVCSVGAWYFLQAVPHDGVLQWSGLQWLWVQGSSSTLLQNTPYVVMDVQSLLVLCWRDQQGRPLYCVLQRNWAPHRWKDVRRAVYSSFNLPQDESKAQAL